MTPKNKDESKPTKGLPAIEFEGVLVTGKKVYRCPFCKGSKGYPTPTWKTEAGFRGHMKKCFMRPSSVAHRKALNAVLSSDWEANNKARGEWLDAVMPRIETCFSGMGMGMGAEIYFVTQDVVSPTHVFRGTRVVRVRYKPIVRHRVVASRVGGLKIPVQLEINPALVDIPLAAIDASIDVGMGQGWISINMVFLKKEDAQARADRLTNIANEFDELS